jgi:hypothetical protein
VPASDQLICFHVFRFLVKNLDAFPVVEKKCQRLLIVDPVRLGAIGKKTCSTAVTSGVSLFMHNSYQEEHEKGKRSFFALFLKGQDFFNRAAHSI